MFIFVRPGRQRWLFRQILEVFFLHRYFSLPFKCNYISTWLTKALPFDVVDFNILQYPMERHFYLKKPVADQYIRNMRCIWIFHGAKDVTPIYGRYTQGFNQWCWWFHFFITNISKLNWKYNLIQNMSFNFLLNLSIEWIVQLYTSHDVFGDNTRSCDVLWFSHKETSESDQGQEANAVLGYEYKWGCISNFCV